MPQPAAFSRFAETIVRERYAHASDQKDSVDETWRSVADRVGFSVAESVSDRCANWRHLAHEASRLIYERKFIPAGRYLAACGRPMHQTQNCLLNRVEDSREGWGEHVQKAMVGLMSGAGLGVNYSRVRARGEVLKRTGGYASGPIALIEATNELGRCAMSGGSRRAALWAGLSWSHPDAMDFVGMKDWSDEIHRAKADDFNFKAPFDQTNISICLDDEFFAAIRSADHPRHGQANAIYRKTVEHMLRTAEPGFSVDIGDNAGEDLRNACTEVTSRDDSDICNLGSINMARIESLDEMRHVVEVATIFLLAGSIYSDVPYPKVAQVREANRRIGLGLMGLHEFLLKRGHAYGPHVSLVPYLDAYAQSTRIAHRTADEWGISRPVKTRAIAPNGTIGIVAETTTGIEPIFAVALKRRYYHHGDWHFQYIVDATAQRLIESHGLKPEQIETAVDLASRVHVRLEFQGWMQGWVDHGISSTMNLPAWGSALNSPDTVKSFGDKLLEHLPSLRGITAYPDGCRGGQPLTPVDYYEARSKLGQTFVEKGANDDLAMLREHLEQSRRETSELLGVQPSPVFGDGTELITMTKSEGSREGSAWADERDMQSMMPDACSIRGGTCGA